MAMAGRATLWLSLLAFALAVMHAPGLAQDANDASENWAISSLSSCGSSESILKLLTSKSNMKKRIPKSRAAGK